MTTKRLVLKKDTVGELTADEMRAVVGAAWTGKGLPTVQECPLTGIYPTLPVAVCVTTA